MAPVSFYMDLVAKDFDTEQIADIDNDNEYRITNFRMTKVCASAKIFPPSLRGPTRRGNPVERTIPSVTRDPGWPQ
jgi:hypothetical protein